MSKTVLSESTLSVEIPAPLAGEVRAAAEARGLSPEDYVRQQLAFDIALDAEAGDALDWEEDMRRLEEPGEDVDAAVVFAELRENIEKARSSKS